MFSKSTFMVQIGPNLSKLVQTCPNLSKLDQTCLQIFLEQSKLVKKLGVLVLFDQITWMNIVDSWNFVFLLIFFRIVNHKFICDISHIFEFGSDQKTQAGINNKYKQEKGH